MQGRAYQASGSAVYSTMVGNFLKESLGDNPDSFAIARIYCFEIKRDDSRWKDIAGLRHSILLH